MSNPTQPGLFCVEATTVVEAVACTWCGAGVAEECTERDTRGGHPHAQRWRDYWNETHDRSEQTPVYPAPWLATR